MRGAGSALAGLMLAISACGSDGADTTTSEAGATTTSTMADVTTTTSEPTISDLTGNWVNGSFLLEVSDGGEYQLFASGSSEVGQPLIWGFIAREGSQFIFVSSTTGECPGQTGVYEASVSDDVLTLTLFDDPCEERGAGFEEPFSIVTD